ncbi:MAG: hypothetical protein ACRYGR_08275 [Janthinobacterium lividum]
MAIEDALATLNTTMTTHIETMKALIKVMGAAVPAAAGTKATTATATTAAAVTPKHTVAEVKAMGSKVSADPRFGKTVAKAIIAEVGGAAEIINCKPANLDKLYAALEAKLSEEPAASSDEDEL